MRAKTTITALALTLAASAAAAGPAVGATNTSISIQTQSSGVFGFVKSSKSSCHSGRKVTVYRKVAGPDKKAGSDTAQPNQDGSQYSVALSRKGKYYAKVKAISGKCKGATSKTVSFSPSQDARVAHTLTEDRAEEGAESYARKRVNSRTGYVKATVKKCKSIYPHHVDCTIGFDTTKSLPKDKFACAVKVMIFYKAHSEAGESRRMFAKLSPRGSGHAC